MQVEVTAAGAAVDPLDPQVGVAGRRQQGGELAGFAAGRGPTAPGQSLPVRRPGVEVGGGDVQEQRQPAGQPSSAFISAISALWPATIRWESCLLSGC